MKLRVPLLALIGMCFWGVATASAQQKLYWTECGLNAMGRANLDGSAVEEVLATPNPYGIAIDADSGKMYWTDTYGNAIRRANLDGSAVEDLLVFSQHLYPNDIALDVGVGKMYWTDEAGGVTRANLDGSGLETLPGPQHGYEFRRFFGIALDLEQGKMYVADWEEEGPEPWQGYARKILRADFEGTNWEDFLVLDSDPRGIALDLTNGKIYWAEGNWIKRANLDGTGIEGLITGSTIINSPEYFEPLDVALDLVAGKLYCTSGWGAACKIRRADLDGTNVEDLVFLGALANPAGLAIGPIPEPATLSLLALGGVGLVASRRRGPRCRVRSVQRRVPMFRFMSVVAISVCAFFTAYAAGQVPPPGYNMGTIVNGDFEAGFTGWTDEGNASLETSAGNTWVRLDWAYSVSAEDPDRNFFWWSRVSQSFVVPTNASFLTFMHSSPVDEFQSATAEVRIASDDLFSVFYNARYLPAAWTQTSVALPAAMRGRSATVTFMTDSPYPGEGGGFWLLDYVGFDAAGTTPVNPILPQELTPGHFQFTEAPREAWVDPPTASGFEYQMTSGSLFTEIMDFPTGFGPLTVEAEGVTLGTTYGPGDSVEFVALLGHGVSEFTVTQINPLVDPSDPMCFPLKLDFNTDKASFDMIAIPEPATVALLAVGLLALLRRERRLAQLSQFEAKTSASP